MAKEVYVKVISTYKLTAETDEGIDASLDALRSDMQTNVDKMQGYGPRGGYAYEFVRSEDISVRSPRIQEHVNQ